MSEQLAGSAGPHVFVESLDSADAIEVDGADMAHLTRSLRMRDGDSLTATDGQGRWCSATFASNGVLTATSEIVTVSEPAQPATVAFSLTKSSKPEWVIQKLTELGVSNIVVLRSERTVVRWDQAKVDKATTRWERIAVEAAMQSHRVRLPEITGVLDAGEWLLSSGAAICHFGGQRLSEVADSVRSVAIGPEGGWSNAEVEMASQAVSLGETVLRAETAAVAAGTLLQCG